MKKLIMLGLLFTTELYSTPAAPKAEGPHEPTTSRTKETSQTVNKEATDAQHAADANKKSSTEPTPLPRIDVAIDPLSSSQSVDSVHLPDQSAPSPSNIIASGDLFPEEAPTPAITTIKHPTESGWFSPTKSSTTRIVKNYDGTHTATTESTVKNWFSTKSSSISQKIDTSHLTNDQINSAITKIKKEGPDAIKSLIESGSTPESVTATILNKKGQITNQITTNKDGSQIINNYDVNNRQIGTTTLDAKGNISNPASKTKAYFNAKGHFVTKEGLLADENGSLVNENSQGEWVNAKGQLVDEFGYIEESSIPSVVSPSVMPQISGLVAA